MKSTLEDHTREWSLGFDNRTGGNFIENVQTFAGLVSDLRNNVRYASNSYLNFVKKLEEELNAWAAHEENERRANVEHYLDEDKMKHKLTGKIVASGIFFILGLGGLVFNFGIAETTGQLILLIVLTILYTALCVGMIFIQLVMGKKSIETITEDFDDMPVLTIKEYRAKETELLRKNAEVLKKLDQISVYSKYIIEDLENFPNNPYDLNESLGKLAIMRRIQINADGGKNLTKGDLPPLPEKISTINPDTIYLDDKYKGNTPRNVEESVVRIREFVEDLSARIVLQRLQHDDESFDYDAKHKDSTRLNSIKYDKILGK